MFLDEDEDPEDVHFLFCYGSSSFCKCTSVWSVVSFLSFALGVRGGLLCR